MANKALAVFGVLALNIYCFSQSKNEQIKALQKNVNESEQRVIKTQELAEKFNRLAQESQKETERQRYLAIATRISRTSLEIENNSLAALLALQAYNFNIKYQGSDFDRDIYNGLLSALERFNKANTILEGKGEAISSLITKPESQSVLAVETTGRITRWTGEADEWQSEELTPPKTGYDVYAVNIKTDGRLLVVGAKTRFGKLDVYDLAYSASRIEGINSKIENINFVPRSNGFYALINSGGSIFYGDYQKAEEVISSKEKITLMDLSSDGNKLAGITVNGKVLIWNVAKDFSESVYKIFEEEDQITAMAFAPNGRDLIFGNKKGEIFFVALESGVIRSKWSWHISEIKQFVFCNSGTKMAVIDKSNTIRIWNLGEMNLLPILIKENSPIASMSFSPDEKQVLCATEKSNSVRVWPLSLEKMAKELCGSVKMNMTAEEWENYVSRELPYESTCADLPSNNK
jgi:WD40 repeat protein